MRQNRKLHNIKTEVAMKAERLRPGHAKWGVILDPQSRAAASRRQEPQQAGTPLRLQDQIDNGIDKRDHKEGLQQIQPYHIRLLVSRHAVSPNIATIIAAELGMGGAL
jgi:hypothetical protein